MDFLLRTRIQVLIGILLFVSVFFYTLPAFALEPREILVLCNFRMMQSRKLAEYYIKVRGIPKENLLKLGVTNEETCTREEYKSKVAFPVKKYLSMHDPQHNIHCLLVMYGLPLRIAETEILSPEMSELKKKQKELKYLLSNPESDEMERERCKEELQGIEDRIAFLKKWPEGASLDSELAMVLEGGYDLAGWQPNPFYVGYGEKYENRREDVLMVSRLDGPSPEIVRRIIDESIAVEKTGLTGRAYFDARWPRKENLKTKNNFGYDFYDSSIYKAADIVQRSGIMPVIVNSEPGLFQRGDCPEAALYCGWYSLAKYIDAFEWRPGSVGYHIASSECSTLKRLGSSVWCKRMLEEGAAAVLGPVNEPYVQAFPVPELFFRFLLDGYWTLSESYALSEPFLSWQMILIGDPLYRPFYYKNKKAQ